MISKILVPTDFSDPSSAALSRAEELARLAHAELLILLVRDEFPFIANDGTGFVPAELFPQHASERALVRDLAAESVRHGVRASGVMVLGAAPERILSVAEAEQVDLIIMGTHGRRGLGHAVLGSVAESVVRTSPIPVMSVSTAHSAASRANAGGTPTWRRRWHRAMSRFRPTRCSAASSRATTVLARKPCSQTPKHNAS